MKLSKHPLAKVGTDYEGGMAKGGTGEAQAPDGAT